MSISPSLLYKTSAAISALTIPGHILLGLQHVHPPLSGLKPLPRRSAQASFNYINASLLISAFLNLQWARLGGPSTLEEKAVLATLVIAGAIDGATYLMAGYWPPLGCMWVAPACSLAAYLME